MQDIGGNWMKHLQDLSVFHTMECESTVSKKYNLKLLSLLTFTSYPVVPLSSVSIQTFIPLTYQYPSQIKNDLYNSIFSPHPINNTNEFFFLHWFSQSYRAA